MSTSHEICTRCVMDGSVPDIRFDEHGACNFCADFLRRCGPALNVDPARREQALQDLVARVKAGGKGKRYDCVVGVSGGVDSSWALVQAVKLGLRPLAAHMDNGWNSELAQNNIANLVRGLGVDLYTHVIDWNEYRGLMQAFFDADVIDIELLYDNAMFAVNYQQAARYGVKFILAGSNQATEGLQMPPQWNWFKFDKRNIRALGRRGGRARLGTFPAMGTLDYVWYEYARRIRWIPFLDYLDYNKARALQTLQQDYGYKPYLFKHYESVFTRFYQGYILPAKFGVDKRRVHLSALICSGQLTRSEAMRQLQGIAYASEQALQEDRQYFLKKMGWTSAQLDEYVARPEKSHASYPSERPLWDWLFSNSKAPFAHRMLKSIYKLTHRR
jgi:N-acetyl sugar amidotransferase